ncbi:AraC family transcriptional regulator [Paludibacter sp. 221]|uniref:helix-turn-helix domain-containing protein n=1 Tax=Paludibacter sp. 221 TaxID=2302939 RepID=UPI0013D85813|nr:helix-turn-helix transcriptional regulator [Paludibacter sp. 221]
MWIVTALVMGISTYIWSVFIAGVSNYELFYKLELVEAFTTLLLLPLLYLCFRTLTNEKSLCWKDFLWFLPAILIGGSMLLLYIIMGDEYAIIYIREMIENQGKLITFTGPVYRVHNFISGYLYTILVLAQIIYILIYATVRLVNYRHRLNDFFSNREGKSIENGTALLVVLYIVLILSLLTYRGRFHYNESTLFVNLLMIVWAVVLYVLGYNVYNLRYTAENFAQDLELSDNKASQEGYGLDEESNADSEDINNLNTLQMRVVPELTRLMDEEKIFLKNDLRMDEVARLIHTNRTYISRIIHEEYHCNFADFVNSKRIKYAQDMVRSNPHLTQEQVAELSGFIHTSTFSRVFKQHTGVTFREFMKGF